MGIAASFVGPVSKVLARLHRWYATAWLLARLPLATIDDTLQGRLRYALMMANKSRPAKTRRLLQRILKRNRYATADLLIELAATATVIGQPSEATRLLRGAISQAAPGSHTLDAAQRLLHANEGITNGSLQTILQAVVDSLVLPDAAPVTLVPVSGKYLELWQLWLRQVREHVGRQVVAMVLDDAALTALAGAPDVAVVDVRESFSWDERGRLHPHTRGVLWHLRVLLLQGLVRCGHPTLVLDLDAMPIGDLSPLFQQMAEVDIVAQHDHSIPMDVDRQLGFVLCCGFMLWRPTPASKKLLERFALATAVERDDQLALNHLLVLDGITQRQEENGVWFESAGVRFACPYPSEVSRSLHSGTVIRHFHQQGESVAEIRAALSL